MKTFKISFKKIALAQQFNLTDSSGNVVFYAKQKLFKFKEHIKIFADSTQTDLKYEIRADRVIDFSPLFTATDAAGKSVVSIKRRGAKSILKAHYDVLINDQIVATMRERDAWVKVLDAFLDQVPGLNLFSGYFFNPSYLMLDLQQNEIADLTKDKSFLESSFTMNIKPNQAIDEEASQLAMTILLLLERFRG